MTAIEDKIDGLNALRAKADTLESAMRGMRLGAHVEMKFKRFFWKDEPIAFGYGRQKSEPLPIGIEADFYEFLSMRKALITADIRKIEKELEGIES